MISTGADVSASDDFLTGTQVLFFSLTVDSKTDHTQFGVSRLAHWGAQDGPGIGQGS